MTPEAIFDIAERLHDMGCSFRLMWNQYHAKPDGSGRRYHVEIMPPEREFWSVETHGPTMEEAVRKALSKLPSAVFNRVVIGRFKEMIDARAGGESSLIVKVAE